MKKLLLILLVIISSCFFGSIMNFSEKDIVGKENVVFNPSFENGEFEANSMPEDWMVLNKPENQIFWDDNYRHSGGKSLKIQYPKSKINIISDAFPIDAEAVYYSRCFVKSSYQSNHPVTIRFLAFNSKGKRVNKFSSKGYPGEDWTQIDLTSGFLKSTARFGRIIISIPKKPDKIFWLDDIDSYNVYKIQK